MTLSTVTTNGMKRNGLRAISIKPIGYGRWVFLCKEGELMKYYVIGFISTLTLLILTDKILLKNAGKE